jgi:hypothetical protein
MRQAERVGHQKLEIADHLAVAALKKLRRRSKGNPHWRDAPYLQIYLRRRYLRWAEDSPLEGERVGAERALDRYQAAAKRGGERADDEWMSVLVEVDALIAEAERLQGHKIKPRP